MSVSDYSAIYMLHARYYSYMHGYNAICRTCTAALECVYILELEAGSHVRTHVTERRHVVCKLERPSFKWLNGSGCSAADDDGNGDVSQQSTCDTI